MQELEGSSHLIGSNEVLVVQVRLAKEESNDGDLGPVKVVGDAEHVVLLFRWGAGLSLHVGDDVLPLAGPVVVVNATLTEHLESRPCAHIELEK